MKPLSAAEVRRRYLEFFAQRGHQVMASDSLVPANDPTLLFTGAGMNQFKDMFLGKGTLPWKRITTSQKCLRVPDLENVGFTARHHTFFEMLGNFSFGDYFKKECIQWEWEFFRDACGIPENQMVVTIYESDDEAFEIWTRHVGLSPDKVFRFGEKENFWPAEAPSKGPNGPCGPCSEIYFDSKPGQPYPDKRGLKELPDDRFTEIGNCVFTQFDRQSDGTLKPLPQKNIDVGLGLERIAAVLQGAKNNFETELFRPYLEHLGRVTEIVYGTDKQRDIRMRRIADHVRAVTFCIADGALPGNEGRGYVVRKILRRAARDGYELGLHEPFLFTMVDLVGQLMGDQYPEVRNHAPQCRAVIKSEEESFLQTYSKATPKIHAWLANPTQAMAEQLGVHVPTWVPPAGQLPVPERGQVLPLSGVVAFHLHDTHGLPVDISQRFVEERGFRFDDVGFERAMEEQRQRARASMATADAVFTASVAVKLRDAGHQPGAFVGYESLTASGKLLALVGEGDALQGKATVGQKVVAIADKTPFYAQGGGQVGDRGTIQTATGLLRVHATTALDGFHLHQAVVESGHVEAGQSVELRVDDGARRATERNHTATHLLHAALKKVLGDHVSQAGSEVAPERLRFDYTQPEKPTAEQLQRVEDEVNAQILLATPVLAVVRGLQEARSAGFVALFGEKYGDRVRTLQVGDFSKELCGGTHVANSGNIGAFRIVAETAVAAGTRRLEAVTGTVALQMAREERQQLATLAQALKVPTAKVIARVTEITDELKKVRKDLEKAMAPDLDVELGKLAAALVRGAGNTVVYVRPGLQTKDAQDLLARARKAHDPLAAVVLAPVDGEVVVVTAVSEALVGKLKAGDLLKAVTNVLGGGGGGRPDMAQGKGKDGSKLNDAVAAAEVAFRTAGLRA
ncbi:MAG: alanine--tRNA ligase [Planctomycetes bacterium]|nr:alanine--tRNA ligase [Planctomycetota bacterium]